MLDGAGQSEAGLGELAQQRKEVRPGDVRALTGFQKRGCWDSRSMLGPCSGFQKQTCCEQVCRLGFTLCH